MSFTDPNNLVDPELLTEYATAQYFEGIKVARSGILANVDIPGLDTMSSVITMPSWEIIGAGQVLAPGADITFRDLNDHTERHPVVRRYNGVLNLELARIIAKSDPNVEVSRQISTSVARDLNRSAIASLQGGVASNTGNQVGDSAAAPGVTDITALENIFEDILEEVMVNGTGILGMRSAVYNAYKELGLVADPTVGDKLQDEIVAGTKFTGFRGTLLGHMIIVDDEIHRGEDDGTSFSKTTGDALTYLIGVGALKSAVQKELNVEQDRDIAKKADEITWDVHRSFGLRGMDYTATVDKQGPTDVALQTTGNWSLVAEDSKLVPVANIQTNHP